MPLDPGEERWLNEKLGRLETRVDQLFVAAQQIAIKANVMDERLKASESRNKILWGVTVALVLSLVGGFSAHMAVVGSLQSDIKANVKTVDGLAAQFRDHEQRSSIPKHEPAK